MNWNITPNKQPWYGFTEDQIFGEIMSDPEICKYILRIIAPEAKIKHIYPPNKQREVKDPGHRKQKDVRLDVLVEDEKHNLYDLEVQTSDKGDLGWRMRYYASKIDQRYTLPVGKTYRDLRKVTIIFICTFDPQKKGKVRYEYESFEKVDKSDQLNDGIKKIIINTKGKQDGIGPELAALVNLANNKQVHLNRIFDKIQKKIVDINNDPKRRDEIMDYETKLLEREQDGKEEGIRQGIQKLIAALRDFGATNAQILKRLEQDYGDQFTKKRTKRFHETSIICTNE